MPTETSLKAEEALIHVLWINAGLSCDGDSVALTAATQPSIEEIALGALPGLPRIAVHWPLIDFECGPNGGADDFLEWFFKADRGELEPFVLVVEGSIPNEKLHERGLLVRLRQRSGDRAADHHQRVAGPAGPQGHGDRRRRHLRDVRRHPRHGGQPDRRHGRPDYLGWDWKSKAGIPIVCVPGCPIQPDNLSETLTYLLYMATGQAPMIPLDEALRPTWLFGKTVHEGCDRAGYYEQGDFATEYGSPKCIVKLGCWGPVVKCNVPKRGWINGVGGCPNVGGICIGCTMPGLPGQVHALHGRAARRQALHQRVGLYGAAIRALRSITTHTLDQEPKWRTPGRSSLTGARAPGRNRATPRRRQTA